MNTEVMTNGAFAWYAGPDSAISDAHWVAGPTLAELLTLVNHSKGVKVDGTDFALGASEQGEDRSFADQAGAKSRGVMTASGSIEVYTPGRGDTTSPEAKAYDTFGTTRTRLAVLQRPVVPNDTALAAGQEVNIFRVITDDRQHNRNDSSRTLGMGLVLQGNVFANYIIPAAIPTQVTVTGGDDITVGDVLFLKAVYHGRNVTAGATYLSSDEGVVKVTPGGVILGVAAGTATVTVSVPGSAAGTPITIVVAP